MFDMTADMRALFTWNTKLIFLYITAEYKTELNALNQIVIWDYIIEDVEHAQLTVGRAQTMLLPRHHNEYPLIDQVRSSHPFFPPPLATLFRQSNRTLTLSHLYEMYHKLCMYLCLLT